MQHITQASNADTHSGLLDKTSTCHTTEEVQAEHQAKAVSKAKAAAEKQANIKKVAQPENKAREKANNANCKANHPTDKLTIPQAKRARKEDATVDPEGSMSETQTDTPEQAPKTKRAKMTKTTTTQLSVVKPMPSKSKNIVGETQVVESANNTTRALSVDEEVAPEPEESVDSGSDYGKSKEDLSSKDKDDIVFELENDEPDTVIKHKKGGGGGGKKPKKGLVAQDQINMFVGINKIRKWKS